MNLSFALLSGSIEQGLAYGILALGVFLTFRILNFPDLTVDGSFPLGGAVAATLIVGGTHPLAATAWAVVCGLGAGLATGILHTKLRITGLLAGILTMSALYSVNLRIMGRSNVPLLREPTLFTHLRDWGFDHPYQALVVFLVIAVGLKMLADWFLATELGLAIRATGDNPRMIRSLGVDTEATTILGLSLANGLAALSGALVAQYQGFADVGMGIGMIVVGAASVIIGSSLIRWPGIFWGTLAALVGSVVYRLAVFFALRAGFAPTDLKIVTSLLVVGALALPTLRERMQASRWRATERRRQVHRANHSTAP